MKIKTEWLIAFLLLALVGGAYLYYDNESKKIQPPSEEIQSPRIGPVGVREQNVAAPSSEQANQNQNSGQQRLQPQIRPANAGDVDYDNPRWDRINIIFSIVNLILLIMLGFVLYKLLAMIRVSASYQKERLREKGSLLVFPEQFESDMKQLISKVMSDLDSLSKGNTQSIEINKNGVSMISAALIELKEVMKIYADQLVAKEAEAKRFREGYDAYLISKFLSSVAEMRSSVIKEMNRSAIDKEKIFFQEFLEYIDDSLKGAGIEPFAPEVGSSISDAYGIDLNYKKIPTSVPSQHGLIHEILEPGLRVVSTLENIQPMKKAVVSVFNYQETGE